METLLAAANRASQVWLQWMWPMAWQAALMGLAVLGVALLARKASPRFRYFLWCLLLLKLCLPPSLAFVTGVGQWVLPKQAAVVPVAAPPSVVTDVPGAEVAAAPVAPLAFRETAPAVSIPPAAPAAPAVNTPTARPVVRLSWIGALAGIWCLGALALIGLFVVQHRRMARRLAAARPVTDEATLRLLEESKSALGITSRVALVSAENLHSPILFGAFRPRIAIPRHALESLPADQIRPILLHELAHLRRKDLWVNFVQWLVMVLYWFHPAVCLANRQLRRERELIVDDIVLAQLAGGRESYSASLLSIVKQGAQRQFLTPAYVGIVETPGSLAHRLRRILDMKRKLSLRLGWAGLAALIVLGLVLIPQARSQTPEKATPEKSATTFRVRGEAVRADGRPLEGARLLLYHNKGWLSSANSVVQEAVSGADGKFEFKDPVKFDQVSPHSYAQDKYVVIAVHPDYAFAWANVTQGEVKETYRLRLTAPQTKTVQVADVEGKLLKGATVRVDYAGGADAPEPEFRAPMELPTGIVAPLSAKSDAEGTARLQNLPATRVYFTASLPGYARTNIVSTSDKEPYRILLSRAAQLSGRLVNEGGQPIPGATLRLQKDYSNVYETTTGADGAFAFQDVLATKRGGKTNDGGYLVTLQDARYAMRAQSVELKPGESLAALTLKAIVGTKVRVQALDPASKQPIAGARIQGDSAGTRLNGFTDSTGALSWTLVPGDASFFFHSPPDGTYTLDEPGKEWLPVRVKVGAEPQTVTVFAAGKLGRLITLRGRVQLPGGAPAAGVLLVQSAKERFGTAGYVGGSGTTVRTDAAGAFEFKGMPGGLTVLVYGETKDHENILAQEIPLPAASEELAQPLVMQRGQTAEIVLKDENGAPRANMALKLAPSRAAQWMIERSVKTDAQGKLRVNGILPGMEYSLVDATADRSQAYWESKSFHATVQLIPVGAGAAVAPPVSLVAPLNAETAVVKVVDTRGTVVPVKEIGGLVITMKDGTPWYPGIEIRILGRTDDGALVTDRKALSIGGAGAKLKLTVYTETGSEMTATGVYPADGSNRLLFTTAGAMLITETAPGDLPPQNAGVKILDPQGQPVANAKVMLYPPARNISAVTDAQGTAIFKDSAKLRRGFVEIEADGFALQWVYLLPGKVLIVRMDNTTRMAGKLFLPDGKPAGAGEIHFVARKLTARDGADVDFEGLPLLRPCDDQGRYDFLLMPGVYDVEALTQSGYFGKWTAVRVERGKVTALPEKLEPAARLEIRVVDSVTKKPVPGVEFYILEKSYMRRPGSPRTTDANGLAAWETLAPGAIWVDLERKQFARCWSDQSKIKMRGKEAESGKPQLRDGVDQLAFDLARGMAPVKVVVERAVTATGRVLDPDGKPVEKAWVNVVQVGAAYSFTGDYRYQRPTAADGAYALTFPAGNGVAYSIVAHDPQNRWADVESKPFESKAGDAFTFDLKLQGKAPIPAK